ncbi:MAG: heterodisulfide reductase-related iron-sulfur binding cluster, partial [Candidatus Latescibacteria bacterium]|nr:heterodisulfide reductase-related iron-sulfur binding cluster [Candidatus Latescibacterota bacterium]
SNWANENVVNRLVMQGALGIDKRKQLPTFTSETFRKWFNKRGAGENLGTNGKVVLFYTCFTNYNDPSVGRDVVEVLERNDVEVVCPEQNCCGMPAIDVGDIDFAVEQAASNIRSLYPYVEQGYDIVCANPTCTYMLKKEYTELMGTTKAAAVAEATYDVSEWLVALAKQKKLDRNFIGDEIGKIVYHVPCHLKAQNVGFKSRDLLRILPGAEVELVDRCCAHDGTWAMRKDYFEISMQWGGKAFEGMQNAKANIAVSDCPPAAIHIEQATGIKPQHPISVLNRWYAPLDSDGDKG